MNDKPNLLAPLIAGLRNSPSRDMKVSREKLSEIWDRLRHQDQKHITRFTPAIMAAVVLSDEDLKSLLTKSEYDQLLALAKLAVERYEQRTTPNNRIGNVIVGLFKEPE